MCIRDRANAATALAAVEQLPFDISVETIKRSLIEVELVGRFQQLKGNQLEKLAARLSAPYSQLPKVIIDVGHNPHACLLYTSFIARDRNIHRQTGSS